MPSLHLTFFHWRLAMTRLPSIPAALILMCGLVPAATAQLPQIRLSAVYPQGGAAGSTLQVAVTESTDADELADLFYAAYRKSQQIAARPVCHLSRA